MSPKAGPSKVKDQSNGGTQAIKYKNASEISAISHIQDETALHQALSSLRNQLTVRHQERVEFNDERVLLVQSWLGSSPGAKDLFEIWEQCKPRHHALTAIITSLFSHILVLLSSHYTYHALGAPIVSTLLSQSWMTKINANLTSSHNDLILSSLKLLNAVSSFAGGRDRRSLLDVFAWESKPLAKLYHMRRRGKQKDDGSNILFAPDIRTLYILFLASFIDQDTPSSIKSAFLEQRRDSLAALFKGLPQDPYPLVQKILETFWNGVWSDPKVKRTLKVGLFNESAIIQIVKLYERSKPEGADSEEVPADLVHHFLLAICTRPGVGVCFKDRGWYPRENVEDGLLGVELNDDGDSASRNKGGKIYNRILSNVLKSLRVNEDSRQQELASRILQACPELVAGYWSGCGLTFEPRLSSKWIANISFFGSIISQSVPRSSFLLPSSSSTPSTSTSPAISDQYNPNPPSLSTIIENVFPTLPGGPGAIKIHFSKGLQSSSGLVQHCTALALVKCLAKFNEVLRTFQNVGEALEEDDVNEYYGGIGTESLRGGRWGKRRMEVEREVRKRVPEVQVVIAFAQQKAHVNANPAKTALLRECAQRLLWLYHRCLPSLVAEAKFDVGKLLHSIQILDDSQDEEMADADALEISGLERLRQLHVLRLLESSDQFSWFGKAGPRSNLHILLTLYTTAPSPSIQFAVQSLLQSSLAKSVLFQHDPDEFGLWLDSLRSNSDDDVGPTSGVVAFLDECIQRCYKTPYKFIEDLQQLGKSHPSSTRNGDQDVDMESTATGTTSTLESDYLDDNTLLTHPETYPSPLLVTVLSQLPHRVSKARAEEGSLVEEILPVVSFVRNIIWRLFGKVERFRILSACVDMVEACFEPRDLEVIEVRDELRILRAGLACLQHPPSTLKSTQAESTGLELGAPRCFLESRPIEWIGVAKESEESPRGSFLSLFLHSSDEVLSDEGCRNVLSDTLFFPPPNRQSCIPVDIKRAICTIDHRFKVTLSSPADSQWRQRGLLMLVSLLFDSSAKLFTSKDVQELKEYIIRGTCIRYLFTVPLNTVVREGVISHHLVVSLLNLLSGMQAFLRTVLAKDTEYDRALVSDAARFWFQTLHEPDNLADSNKVQTALLWIPYMDESECFLLLQHLIETTDTRHHPEALQSVLEVLVSALKVHLAGSAGTKSFPSPTYLEVFVRLQDILPDSTVLDEAIASALSECLPPFCDGTLSSLPHDPASDDTTVHDLLDHAKLRWDRRRAVIPPVDLIRFLHRETWSRTISEIVSGFIYAQPKLRKLVWDYLAELGDNPSRKTIDGLAKIVFALVDTSQSDASAEHLAENIVPAFRSFVEVLTTSTSESLQTKALCSQCVSAVIHRFPSVRPRLLAILQEAISGASKTLQGIFHILTAVRTMISCLPEDAEVKDIARVMVDRGLIWAVEELSSSFLDDASYCAFSEMGAIVEQILPNSSHLVEPVVTVVIQDFLGDVDALKLARQLVKYTPLKPVLVNRFIQSIIQHPKFYPQQDLPRDGPKVQAAVIDLLAALFGLYPSNTCQTSHVEPLGPLYGGSMSSSDRKLLDVFKLYESTKHVSISPLFGGGSTRDEATSTLNRILALDPNKVFKTCLAFPQWRSFHDDIAHYESDEELYDPVYIILLFCHMLPEHPPASAVTWVQLFRSNAVALVIRSLSSCSARMREAALSILMGIELSLKETDMVEKPHVEYILHLLKNLYNTAAAEGLQDSISPPEPPRLPAYTTLHFCHSLRGIFYPSNFVYPLTARHLLQRPTFDPSDVPMLFGMFYSSSTEQWKKERGWIVKFLSDGMQGGLEWRVLKRRFTWDLVASRFENEVDRNTRKSILELLANITCNTSATTSLVLKSALLSWIGIQVQSMRQEEAIAWVKIIENISVSENRAKFEHATNGEWRFSLGRCISNVLACTGCSSGIYLRATQVLLRLALLPGTPIPNIGEIVSLLVDRLDIMGKNIHISLGQPSSWKKEWDDAVSLPPHSSKTLWKDPEFDTLWIWGKSVESLWRVVIISPSSTHNWDRLNQALLVWRAIVGERTAEGEWARKEVVKSMDYVNYITPL